MSGLLALAVCVILYITPPRTVHCTYRTPSKQHVYNVAYTLGEVTSQSIVTIRSPFCGYNLAQCVDLMGEDLPCYSNKI